MYTIYQVTNIKNNKSYVGFTTLSPPENRWKRHQTLAKLGYRGHFYNAIRKDGVDSFSFMILEQGADSHYGLTVQEPKYIQALEEEHRYNETMGGEGVIGYKITKEQRQRISERMKGTRYAAGARTAEFKQRLSALMIGRVHHSQETRDRLSQALLGIDKPIIVCPHCQQHGGKPAMTRWHFDNCKRKL